MLEAWLCDGVSSEAAFGARAQEGSGELGLTSEAKGLSEPESVPEPWCSQMVCFVFCYFYYYDLDIFFMVPNK